MTTQIQTLVIGGGQAGLSVGYHLSRRRMPFVILEANTHIGDTWRNRWDSLRLFTPARFDGLDGMRFPAGGNVFPTKNEMADYLEAYARRFHLPVSTGTRVTRVSKPGPQYLVETDRGSWEADNVVVAMATYQAPRIPAFASELAPHIVQLHSVDYRNPAVFKTGGVLVVGAGNSGAEVALEASRNHRTYMSGRDTGHVPFRVEGLAGRTVLMRFVLRVLFHRVLTVATPVGRKVRPTLISRGGPLIRIKPWELTAAGIERVPRVAGTKDGLPMLADGRVLDVANVVWCTGFHPGLSWLDLPVFGSDGDPRHDRGIVRDEPGLYFVGLQFLYAFSSTMIHGVGRDAERIVKVIAQRARVAKPASQPLGTKQPFAA